MEKVVLYTKLGCPLGEEAYLMLLELTGDIPMEIDIVDITHSHNNHLVNQYAHRIPVLASPGRNAELEWPFTQADIRTYLAGK